MPIYDHLPEADGKQRRFVRVQGDIFVCYDGDTDSHEGLATQSGVFERLLQLKDTSPSLVDGGYVKVDIVEDKPVLTVLGLSPSLGLPIRRFSSDIRRETFKLLEKLNPSIVVVMGDIIPRPVIDVQ